MRNASILAVLAIILLISACSESEQARTKDPLEALTYEYVDYIRTKDWDKAYAMLSVDTQKYYKKDKFIEYAKSFILPKVDAIYVTKIEKRKLDADITTAFKPKSSWATYNTMKSALVNLFVQYKDGKWYIHYKDIVDKAIEEEKIENDRKARVAKWSPHIKFLDFKIENTITEEGPMLVFNGEMENTAEELLEMAMVMVEFLGAKGEKVYSVVVVPVYISAYEEKAGLKGKSKMKVQSTISSQIPDTWVGKINYRLWDAGKMPQKQ